MWIVSVDGFSFEVDSNDQIMVNRLHKYPTLRDGKFSRTTKVQDLTNVRAEARGNPAGKLTGKVRVNQDGRMGKFRLSAK